MRPEKGPQEKAAAATANRIIHQSQLVTPRLTSWCSYKWCRVTQKLLFKYHIFKYQFLQSFHDLRNSAFGTKNGAAGQSSRVPVFRRHLAVSLNYVREVCKLQTHKG